MSDAPTSLRLPPFLRGSRHVAGFGATASLKITLDEQRVHLRGMWEANGGEPSLAVPSPFIVILLHILEHARPDVVAWLPDNAGFVIKQPGCFIRDVLPPYFAGRCGQRPTGSRGLGERSAGQRAEASGHTIVANDLAQQGPPRGLHPTAELLQVRGARARCPQPRPCVKQRRREAGRALGVGMPAVATHLVAMTPPQKHLP